MDNTLLDHRSHRPIRKSGQPSHGSDSASHAGPQATFVSGLRNVGDVAARRPLCDARFATHTGAQHGDLCSINALAAAALEDGTSLDGSESATWMPR